MRGVFRQPRLSGRINESVCCRRTCAGKTHSEEDEEIEIRLVRLSEILKAIEKGEIMDGKTLSSIPLYARLRRR